jgi:hypothetical protein
VIDSVVGKVYYNRLISKISEEPEFRFIQTEMVPAKGVRVGTQISVLPYIKRFVCLKTTEILARR